MSKNQHFCRQPGLKKNQPSTSTEMLSQKRVLITISKKIIEFYGSFNLESLTVRHIDLEICVGTDTTQNTCLEIMVII